MPHLLPTGVLINREPFELNGVAYPGNWIENASPEELTARGIVAAVPPPATPQSLASIKAASKVDVSIAAEEARHKYITPGSGKAMSYQQVAAEAIRYAATEGSGTYPFLQARVDSGRYADLAAAAAETLAIEQQWAAIGSAIDRIEDAAKLAIDAASTVEQVAAAVSVTWP